MESLLRRSQRLRSASGPSPHQPSTSADPPPATSSPSKTLSISDLPDDMLYEIFDHLPVKQVFAIQTVDKKFHRCSKRWLQTVDQLTVFTCDNLPRLWAKKEGTATGTESYFPTSNERLFPTLEHFLTVCSGIDDLELKLCSPLMSATQLVQLVRRCDKIRLFALEVNNERMSFGFGDDDWTSLVEMVQSCDIYLKSSSSAPTPKQLQLLFTSAKRIKIFDFQYTLDAFRTVAFLDPSATIKVRCTTCPAFYYAEFCHFLNERVAGLEIDSSTFQALSVSRFSKLTHLHILATNQSSALPMPSAIEMPRLKSLKISGRSQHIWSFFSAVRRLDQLEKLEFNFIADEQQSTEMLNKTPNIKELAIELFLFPQVNVPTFEKLFQLLSQSAIRLETVRVQLRMDQLSAVAFNRVVNALKRFAERKSETKLELDFIGTEKPRAFEEKIKTLPHNVQIYWHV